MKTPFLSSEAEKQILAEKVNILEQKIKRTQIKFSNQMKNNEFGQILKVLKDIDNSEFFKISEEKEYRKTDLQFVKQENIFIKDQDKEERLHWEKMFRKQLKSITKQE